MSTYITRLQAERIAHELDGAELLAALHGTELDGDPVARVHNQADGILAVVVVVATAATGPATLCTLQVTAGGATLPSPTPTRTRTAAIGEGLRARGRR